MGSQSSVILSGSVRIWAWKVSFHRKVRVYWGNEDQKNLLQDLRKILILCITLF